MRQKLKLLKNVVSIGVFVLNMWIAHLAMNQDSLFIFLVASNLFLLFYYLEDKINIGIDRRIEGIEDSDIN